jgi:single-strand DNA-binding protein
MAGTNINRVVMTGNLTRDPELRSTGNGLAVCKLRIASNTRRKNGQTGEWEEKPNFFDVTVFGAQGENCSRYLSKGRPVAIDGRLEWREWEQEGQKRQAVDIIADSVQFLGGRDDSGGASGNGFSVSRAASESDVPVDTGDFETAPVAAGASDDDIPF